MRTDDPAYWMLEQGREDLSKRSQPTVYRERCYICRDEEFSLMGLPLCWACYVCGGHVAADDTRCDECAHDHDSGPMDLSVYQITSWADDGGVPFESGWWLDVGPFLTFGSIGKHRDHVVPKIG